MGMFLVFFCWQDVWSNLLDVARLDQTRSSLTSSACESGCRYDRTSKGDIRFVRVIDDESVIYESHRPGIITRIWLTQGSGVSAPLDADLLMRITIDGFVVMELPLADLFSGSVTPFLSPMVGHRLNSAGGYFSYVPLAYQRSCRIGLVHALDRKIWYQVNAKHGAHAMPNFQPGSTFSQWQTSMADPPSDPFQGPNWQDHLLNLAPGGSIAVQIDQSDVLSGLRLTDSPEIRRCWIIGSTESGKAFEMRVADFFGQDSLSKRGVQSLMVGLDGNEQLYSYWPMPFRRLFVLNVDDRDHQLQQPHNFHLGIRLTGSPPHPEAGYFSADLLEGIAMGSCNILQYEGRGLWAGLFLELHRAGTSWEILEGDETVWVDGQTLPAFSGTGVEDIFNGGFYFRTVPGLPQVFARALHGVGYVDPFPEARIGMIRLMLSDAVAFSDSLDVTLEAGPTGNLSMEYRAVNYLYKQSLDANPVVLGGPCMTAVSWWDPWSGNSVPVDSNGNGVIEITEADQVTGWMEVSNPEEQDGVSCYSQLETLVVNGFRGSSFDLSSLTLLKALRLYEAPNLTSIILPHAIESLTVYGAPMLDMLNLPSDVRVIRLHDLPSLTTLDLTNKSLLEQLDISSLNLVDLSLKSQPNLVDLSVSNCPALVSLSLANVPELETLSLRDLDSLATLSMTAASALNDVELLTLPSCVDIVLTGPIQARRIYADGVNPNVQAQWDQVIVENLEWHGSLNQLPVLDNLRALTLGGGPSWLDLSGSEQLRYIEVADAGLNGMMLPVPTQVLLASGNPFTGSPDLTELSQLNLLDLRSCDLTELAGLIGNTFVGTRQIDALKVSDNRLLTQCDALDELSLRCSTSGAFLDLTPQRWDWSFWPNINVAVLIEDPSVTMICP